MTDERFRELWAIATEEIPGIRFPPACEMLREALTAYLRERARAERAEFYRRHYTSGLWFPVPKEPPCQLIQPLGDCNDIRHDWTPEQWEAEVRRRVIGE